jgi:hypothetical protein
VGRGGIEVKYSKDAYEGWVPPRDETWRIPLCSNCKALYTIEPHVCDPIHAAERKVLEACEELTRLYDKSTGRESDIRMEALEARAEIVRCTREWLALRDGGGK